MYVLSQDGADTKLVIISHPYPHAVTEIREILFRY
jgi:hypothetical protein